MNKKQTMILSFCPFPGLPFINSLIYVQVVSDFTLPYHGSGWAAIGSSRQANNLFTLAQFDNFVVNASEVICPVPYAGAALSVMWCGGMSLKFTNSFFFCQYD